jgi:hypothetical protein
MKNSRYFNAMMASAISVSMLMSPIGLAPTFAADSATAAKPAANDWQKDFDAWRAASKKGTAADYQAYLKAFPQGKFAKVAKSRLDALTASAKPALSQPAKDTASADTTKKLPVAKVQPENKVVTADTGMKKPADVAKTEAAKVTVDTGVKKPADVAKADAAKVSVVKPTVSSNADTTAAKPVMKTADTTKLPQVQKPASSDWEQEYALWKAAADGNTIPEYQAYIAAYPKGKFAAIAQSRIDSLTAAEQPAANVTEGDDSQSDTTKANTPADKTQSDTATADQPADDNSNSDTANATTGSQGSDTVDKNQAATNNTDVANSDQNNTQGSNDETTTPQNTASLTSGTPDTEDAALDLNGRAEIQGRLSSLGYDTAGTDGSFGPRSRTAISQWQQANNAPVTAYLSDDQVMLIRQQSKVTYSQWLNGQPVVVERVRPRDNVVVVGRRHGLDAALGVGIIVGGHKFMKMHRCKKRRFAC